MTPYFAYGSNMSSAQMAERCPGARILGPATLGGYRFLINCRGVASVVADATAVVQGLLWLLTRADEANLDRYEGVAEGFYTKEHLPLVDAGSRRREALVYVAREAEPGAPRRGYLEKIVEAAVAHRLPPAYVEELRRWGQADRAMGDVPARRVGKRRCLSLLEPQSRGSTWRRTAAASS